MAVLIDPSTTHEAPLIESGGVAIDHRIADTSQHSLSLTGQPTIPEIDISQDTMPGRDHPAAETRKLDTLVLETPLTRSEHALAARNTAERATSQVVVIDRVTEQSTDDGPAESDNKTVPLVGLKRSKVVDNSPENTYDADSGLFRPIPVQAVNQAAITTSEIGERARVTTEYSDPNELIDTTTFEAPDYATTTEYTSPTVELTTPTAEVVPLARTSRARRFGSIATRAALLLSMTLATAQAARTGLGEDVDPSTINANAILRSASVDYDDTPQDSVFERIADAAGRANEPQGMLNSTVQAMATSDALSTANRSPGPIESAALSAFSKVAPEEISDETSEHSTLSHWLADTEQVGSHDVQSAAEKAIKAMPIEQQSTIETFGSGKDFMVGVNLEDGTLSFKTSDLSPVFDPYIA